MMNGPQKSERCPKRLRVGCYLLLFVLTRFSTQCMAGTPGGTPGPLAGGTPALQSHHKIRVSDQAAVAQVVAQGGRLIADYGAFQLFDAPKVGIGLTSNRRAEVHDEYNLVMLNAARLDTSKPEAQALRKSEPSFAGKRLHLVHFAGPLQSGWLQELASTGVQIVGYIPHDAYLVYGDAPSLARVRTLAGTAAYIQWDGPFADDYRISPAARLLDAQGKPRHIGTSEFAIQLVADPAANARTLQLVDRLKLAPVKQQQRILNYVNLVVQLTAGDLQRLAAQPDVVSIQPWFPPRKSGEREDQIVAGNLAGDVPSSPGYLAWLACKGFTQAQFDASAFVVDLADSGIDNGTTSPNHFGLYAGGNLAGASRVAYSRLVGTPNSGSTLMGCDGHGTIDAHIIAGYDDLPGFPYADDAGFHYGLGVCPFVKVGASVIFDSVDSGGIPTFTSPNFNDLESQAYQSGARISNHSWDIAGTYTYDITAQAFDALVRDAQPASSICPADGNQEMVIVLAAGNEGPGSQTMPTPATAKNVISVGAAENVQLFGGDYGGADRDGITDIEADNANEIFDFSSRGPCSDGRHKPELVAPGTHVSGGVAQAFNPGTNGTADPCFDSHGTISGGPNNSLFWPPGQEFYSASSGSSQAAACVAGGCALVRQYFINHFTNAPSPAMTKAWLMNSARYLTGASANDVLWSDTQGMGEMDLGVAFDGVPRIAPDEKTEDLFTASGQTRTFTGVVADTNQPLRVTLAWTDAPGSTTSSSALNNDLDLEVLCEGVLYKGNVFGGAWSTNGGCADSTNNAESVFLPPRTHGSFVVRVVAANINSDGVPGNEYPVDQDFALVIYNATPSPAPFIEAAGAALLVESCVPTNGVIDPGETVMVNFALKNTGTGSATNLVATLLPGDGVAGPSDAQSYGVLAAGATASMPFAFTASGDCGGTIMATFQLHDDSMDLATVSFTFQLGISNIDGFVCCSMAPEITLQPTNQTVVMGTDVNLLAAAKGTPPLSYRWQFNGGALYGANSNSLALTNIQPEQAGGYALVVANATGSVTSDVVTLTVLIPPGFAAQPTNLTVMAGMDAKFLSAATGTEPFSYQWLFNGTNLHGANSNLLALTNVQCVQAGAYSLHVTNQAGSVTSDIATLAVLLPPAIHSLTFTANAVLISLTSVVGFNYELDYKDSLNDPAWLPASSPIPGTGDVIILEDATLPAASRFYRVRCDWNQ
jgi:hypothetical protein